MNISDHKFLQEGVISYLGNKRKLLPLIHHAITNIIADDDDLFDEALRNIKVCDIFSGSGIVARSLRLAEFETIANDLEDYSVPINETFLTINGSEMPHIFHGIPEKLTEFYEAQGIVVNKPSNSDAYTQTVELLNSVRELPDGRKYFSVHYAPADTQNPDIETERLFYTQENALFIDAVLDVINDSSIFTTKAKNVILASLLPKMTIHINTAGPQKGYYSQWGGTERAALKRILGDIELERLELIDETKGQFFNTYAEKLFVENPELQVDFIYADPPYNTNPYSKNFHLLTTAVRNRDFDVPAKAGKGTKSGIRPDANDSDFSIKENTEDAFKELVQSVEKNTKYLILSYSNDGLLTIDQLVDALSRGGKHSVSYIDSHHPKYKAVKKEEGEKSAKPKSVVEFLVIAKMNSPQTVTEIDKLKKSMKLSVACLPYIEAFDPDSIEMFRPAITVEEAEQILTNYKSYIEDEISAYGGDVKDFKLKAKHYKQLASPSVTATQVRNIAQGLGIWERA